MLQIILWGGNTSSVTIPIDLQSDESLLVSWGYQEQSSWIFVTVNCLQGYVLKCVFFASEFKVKPFLFHFISSAPFSRYSVHCMSNCIPCIGFIYCFVSTADAIKYDVSIVANFLHLYLHFRITNVFLSFVEASTIFTTFLPRIFDVSLSVHVALPSHGLLWELTGRLPVLNRSNGARAFNLQHIGIHHSKTTPANNFAV